MINHRFLIQINQFDLEKYGLNVYLFPRLNRLLIFLL